MVCVCVVFCFVFFFTKSQGNQLRINHFRVEVRHCTAWITHAVCIHLYASVQNAHVANFPTSPPATCNRHPETGSQVYNVKQHLHILCPPATDFRTYIRQNLIQRPPQNWDRLTKYSQTYFLVLLCTCNRLWDNSSIRTNFLLIQRWFYYRSFTVCKAPGRTEWQQEYLLLLVFMPTCIKA